MVTGRILGDVHGNVVIHVAFTFIYSYLHTVH